MIYERVAADAPIEQGDLFRCVPSLEISLSELPRVDGSGEQLTRWRDIAAGLSESSERVRVLVEVEPVLAIAVTQNCDAARKGSICLCQVERYLDVAGQQSEPKDAKAWQSLIVRMMRTNPRLFYLPPAPEFGLAERMAADFSIIQRIPRADLEEMRSGFRVARLKPVAAEHLRESLAFFFRRYAFNEWYPLDREEFLAYQASCREPVAPYEWQRPPAT